MFQAIAVHQPALPLNSSTSTSSSSSSSSSSCSCSSLHHFPYAPLKRREKALLQHPRSYVLHASRPSAPLLSQRGKDLSPQADLDGEEEDLDGDIDEEELDTLFEEFGEVIVTDSRPVTDEVDDDSQSLALAVALAAVANDTKAADILVLHVKPLVYWTRFFVIATAFSRPQLGAIGKKMQDVAAEQFKVFPKGDTKPNSWTLLDFGDVVVHIFLPEERAYYNLEEFYANANPVELPFKSQVVSRMS